MTLPPRAFLFLSLACAAAVATVFLPGLPGAFVFDDVANIVENPALHLGSLTIPALLEAAFTPQPGSTTRVIPMLSFALDFYRAGGMDPVTFKVTNILIHAITTLVLACFLRDLLRAATVPGARARWTALALALAWALHPLQVSSVLYVVQRMQTLATLFVLLAMWAYLRARLAQIEGRAGRTGWMLAGLLWAVALACKEDAILLPAYLLALELTVLRFGAADAGLARALRRGYGMAALAATTIYFLVVLPRYWQSDGDVIRNFSSAERLLTQGRVLSLYLWQILVPLPAHMPFYYDWLQPSRGLLHPWTTLPALLLLTSLAGFAWHLRHRRPLFALGVFWFLSGHFVTSNVIALELAFEHRNHFPLIGVLLAGMDLLTVLASRIRMPRGGIVVALSLALFGLAGATMLRAHAWRSALALAKESTHLAPTSVRAWNSLCVAWYELGGGPVASNPYLGNAIPSCERAAVLGTDSVASLTNVLTFKSLQGTVTSDDWTRYFERLRQVPLKQENVYAMWVLINMVRKEVPLDEHNVLAAIDIIDSRVQLQAMDYAAIGYFILDHTGQPNRAYPYFASAVRASADPKFASDLVGFLRKDGHPDWADRLEIERKQANPQARPSP